MAYERMILERANARMLRRKENRERNRYLLEQELYQKEPELRRLDMALRHTMAELTELAMSGVPVAADGPEIRAIRERNLDLQAQRAELLKRLGYKVEDLEETPFCEKCGDSGWVDGAMCTCLKELCGMEQMKALTALMNLTEEQSFERLRLDVYSDKTWPGADRSPRANMEQVVKVCRCFADQFPNFGARNLLFSGSTGLGKTFLSGCVAREVSRRGFAVVYDTAINLFAAFETRKFTRDAEEEKQARDDTRRYLNCDLLILDDLGSEFTTPMVLSALYDVVNSRLQSGKHTIISTNLSVDQMSERYSAQTMSRIGGTYQELTFYGDDIRMM